MQDLPVTGGLMALRSLPAILTRASGAGRLRGGEQASLEDAEAFAHFDRPGFVRVVTGLWADEEPGPRGEMLRTARRRAEG